MFAPVKRFWWLGLLSVRRPTTPYLILPAGCRLLRASNMVLTVAQHPRLCCAGTRSSAVDRLLTTCGTSAAGRAAARLAAVALGELSAFIGASCVAWLSAVQDRRQPPFFSSSQIIWTCLHGSVIQSLDVTLCPVSPSSSDMFARDILYR